MIKTREPYFYCKHWTWLHTNTNSHIKYHLTHHKKQNLSLPFGVCTSPLPHCHTDTFYYLHSSQACTLSALYQLYLSSLLAAYSLHLCLLHSSLWRRHRTERGQQEMEESKEKSFMSWRWKMRWTRLSLLLLWHFNIFTLELTPPATLQLLTTHLRLLSVLYMNECTGTQDEQEKTFKHLHTFNKSSSNQFVQRHGKLDKSLFAAFSTTRHPDGDLGHSRLIWASTGERFPGVIQKQQQQQLEQQPHFKVVINTTSFGSVWIQQSERRRGECAHLTVSPLVLLSRREEKKRNSDLPLFLLFALPHASSSSSPSSIPPLNVSRLVPTWEWDVHVERVREVERQRKCVKEINTCCPNKTITAC